MTEDRTGTMRRARTPLVLVVVLVVVAVLVAVAVALLRRDDAPEADPGPEKRRRLLEASSIDAGLPAWVQGWRIRYATTDGRGRAVEASGVVLAARQQGSEPRPVLSVAHGTVGIQTECAPSLQVGTFPVVPAEPTLSLLAKGWVAVQSDYIGLGIEGPDGVHPYLDGRSEAHAVLDATRAARSLEDLDLSRRTVLYGASQGGHAALFAGALAPEYASGLDVLGVAAAAPATDFSYLVRNRPEDISSFMISSFLAASWNAVYPEADVEDHVSSLAAAEDVAEHCSHHAAAAAGDVLDAAPLFDPSALDGKLGELFERNTPSARIDAPVLVGQGLSDTVVPAQMQAGWVGGRCAAGQSLEYRTFPALTHATIVAPGSPFVTELVGWIEERRAGAPATPSC